MGVDSDRLQQKITDSGLKLGFIAKKLGITGKSVHNKIVGKSHFKAAEVYVLCDLLRLTDDEKADIFLP